MLSTCTSLAWRNLTFQILQEILVDRSVHAAICRFVSVDLDCGEQKKPTLVKDDFLQAMHEFLPVAMRDVTKIASEGSHHGWEDVGGLTEIRNAIKEVISSYNIFTIFILTISFGWTAVW